MELKISTIEGLISTLALLSAKSNDVHWLSTPDFSEILYVSPNYEKVWQRPLRKLLTQPKIWISYLVSDDIKDHHPIEAMAKRVTEDPKTAIYNETYRIHTPNGQIKKILDRGYPIFDELGNCLAVTGIAIDISTIDMIKNSYVIPYDFPFYMGLKKYTLKNIYKDVYLTRREAQCAFYMLQGKTTKQTSKILGLANRSVQFYLENLRSKLYLSYKPDIIEALLKNGFLDNFI